MAVVCIYLGVRQWRKEQVLSVCGTLRRENYIFDLPNEVVDEIWQRKPTIGNVIEARFGERILFCKMPSGRNAGYVFTWDIRRNEKSIAMLESLGVVSHGTDGLTAGEISHIGSLKIMKR